MPLPLESWVLLGNADHAHATPGARRSEDPTPASPHSAVSRRTITRILRERDSGFRAWRAGRFRACIPAMSVVTANQLDHFRRDGFLVLDGLVDPARCDELRARADQLVAGFEPGELRSIFTTDEQARKTDDYFL